MSNELEQYNLRRSPLKGILSEIAREDGVSRQAVQYAASQHKPRIVARIVQKAESRLAVFVESGNTCG